MKLMLPILLAGTLCSCIVEPLSPQHHPPHRATYGVGDGIVPDLLHPRYQGGFYDYQSVPSNYNSNTLPQKPILKKFKSKSYSTYAKTN